MGRLTDDFDELDFLGWDLALDKAVTTLQARRWYGLTKTQLKQRGFILEPRMIKRTKGSRQRQQVTFALLEEDDRRYSDVALLHLAGTAEIRNVLGVGHVLGGCPEEWSSTAWREAATMVPDALWVKPDGARVAIEFDSTHYDNERVAAKAERFSSFDAQVWGAPTLERVEALRERVCGVDPNAQVVFADPLAGC